MRAAFSRLDRLAQRTRPLSLAIVTAFLGGSTFSLRPVWACVVYLHGVTGNGLAEALASFWKQNDARRFGRRRRERSMAAGAEDEEVTLQDYVQLDNLKSGPGLL